MTENTMTLEQVSHKLKRYAETGRMSDRYTEILRKSVIEMADAIDAHLSRPVSVSDEDAIKAWGVFFESLELAKATTGNKDPLPHMRAALEADRAGRGVVPDAIAGPGVVMSKQDVRDAYYAEGWSAFREAMLAQGQGGARDEPIAVVSGSDLVAGRESRSLHWLVKDPYSVKPGTKLYAAPPQPDAEGGI